MKNEIRWVIGYIDYHGSVHHHVVYHGDAQDSHNHIWASAQHGKWRWIPEDPRHINSYGEILGPEDEDKIWRIIDDIFI